MRSLEGRIDSMSMSSIATFVEGKLSSIMVVSKSVVSSAFWTSFRRHSWISGMLASIYAVIIFPSSERVRFFVGRSVAM